MRLSIIVPVFNEEKTVAEILKRIYGAKLPNRVQKEVIVVNDGSTDKTIEMLKKNMRMGFKLVSFKENKGKGAAVREGMRLSSGDVILIQDADLEYNPTYFSDLLAPILNKNTQVVYGSRFIYYPLKLYGPDRTPLPFHWFGNKFLSFFTNLLFASRITDMETCYKVITKEVANSLRLSADRFEIEPEITAQILKNGYRIVEVPVKVVPRTHDQGKKINWTDGFAAFWTLIRYRYLK